jgi:hypothetical protein
MRQAGPVKTREAALLPDASTATAGESGISRPDASGLDSLRTSFTPCPSFPSDTPGRPPGTTLPKSLFSVIEVTVESGRAR